MKTLNILAITFLALAGCVEKVNTNPKPIPSPTISQSPAAGTLDVQVDPFNGQYDLLRADGNKFLKSPFTGSQIFGNMPQGTYTVRFLPLEGYNVTPESKGIVMTPGATITVNGTYNISGGGGTLDVKVDPATGQYDLLRADGNKFLKSPFTGSQIFGNMPQGTYTVRFLPLEGYNVTPESKGIVMTPGATITVNGIYAK